ncbi:ABC-type antimicrobial peptide transport system, permease component, partial [hydrothermal vent metagenome]
MQTLFKQAIVEMMHHKLRTLLTLLGMVFGVGAVIAMLSIGEGAKVESTRLIESMGLRNLVINEKQNDNETLKEIRKNSIGLSLNDMRAIRQSLPFVTSQCAEKNIKTYSLFSKNAEADSSVMAITAECFTMSNLRIAQGKLFSSVDDTANRQIVVIGAEVAKSLFPDQDPLGQLIKVNHLWVKVVGVLQQQELTKNEIQGIKLGAEHNRIFLPLSTAFKRLKIPNLESQIDSIRVTIAASMQPQIAALAIDRLLKRRHGNIDDFEIIVPASLLNQQNKTQKIFTIVMSSIAGISLLVGGIGIMNIMLATILERTREIGLMRALGATKADIKNQFLVESATIAAVGAILGIIMGVILSFAIQSFANWPVQWSLSS